MAAALFALVAAPAAAQEAAPDPLLLVDRPGLTVRAHLGAGVNAVVESGLFWDLASIFSPQARYEPDRAWLEGYVEPGLSFEAALADGVLAYGRISTVISGTAGEDAYAIGDTGRATLEQGHLGLRFGAPGAPVSLDLSAGRQDYRAGTGMLIANGGSNGFERGALKLGPRKAWETTAIARARAGIFSADLFYLDANELSDNDSETRIVGGTLRADPREGTYLGATLATVQRSRSPYVRAVPGGPPAILPGARDGLSFVDVFARAEPLPDAVPGLWVSAEGAYEWNDRIDLAAVGGRVEIGRVFSELPWRPTLSYAYQGFSGDDPATARLERFDPLFYEGSPRAWATGSKSSMVFINTNVQAHLLTLALAPSPRDILTFRYAHIRAVELRSPLQFGQATRVAASGGAPALVAGVTHPHLSDDLFVEYTRVVTPNAFLTVGASVSFPGEGIDRVAGGRAPAWVGGFANLVIEY
ncbi:hypothetical protein [Salinarimonas rosea]|uniref:hypothetical protein n=1 Tax=Salinarimonas rosea TaxID=552063 RepID=UPI000423D5C1|nr:hypothetical protein [Salinarimonas rosea]